MKSSNLACCWRKLRAAGLVVSSFKVRCMRSWRPFCCGVAGLDPFDLDAAPEPPDRQPAQSEESIGTRKGNAVVGADSSRQAKFLQDALKYRESIGFLSGGESLAGNEIAASE